MIPVSDVFSVYRSNCPWPGHAEREPHGDVDRAAVGADATIRPACSATSRSTAAGRAAVHVGDRLGTGEERRARGRRPSPACRGARRSPSTSARRSRLPSRSLRIPRRRGSRGFRRRRDELRGLLGASEVAGVQDAAGELAGAGEPLSQSLTLLPAHVGEPSAHPRPVDRLGGVGDGLAVADEDESASELAAVSPVRRTVRHGGQR